MNFINLVDNVQALSIRRGVTVTTALIESGVGKNFIFNINKGSTPSAEKIILLADYFSVSVDELLGRKKQPAAEGTGDGLTEAERALLELYRLLTPEQQEMVNQVAKTAAAAQKSPSKPRP